MSELRPVWLPLGIEGHILVPVCRKCKLVPIYAGILFYEPVVYCTSRGCSWTHHSVETWTRLHSVEDEDE